MCLVIKSIQKPKRASKTVYKVMRLERGKLRSDLFNLHRWKEGVNSVKDPVTSLTSTIQVGSVIDGGMFHAYTSKARANRKVSHWGGDKVVIPFKAYAKDFVAKGIRGEEGYTKLTLAPDVIAAAKADYQREQEAQRLKYGRQGIQNCLK